MNNGVKKRAEKPQPATFMIRFKSLADKQAFLQDAAAQNLSGNQLALKLIKRRKK